MAKLICPFRAGSNCDVACVAYITVNKGEDIPCHLVRAASAIGTIGSSFDPALLGSLSGLAKVVAPTVLTRKVGLFGRKPKPPKAG